MEEEIVLVTGTSAGLGLSTVQVLAKQTDKKFKVYASMRKTSKRDELLEKTAGCRNVVVIEMDVCSEDSVNAAVKEILEKEGRIDVVGTISINVILNFNYLSDHLCHFNVRFKFTKEICFYCIHMRIIFSHGRTASARYGTFLVRHCVVEQN